MSNEHDDFNPVFHEGKTVVEHKQLGIAGDKHPLGTEPLSFSGNQKTHHEKRCQMMKRCLFDEILERNLARIIGTYNLVVCSFPFFVIVNNYRLHRFCI